MERLTRRIAGVVVYAGTKNPYSTGQIPCEVDSAGIREMMYRLAAYEDTGLTPESVEALKLSMMGKAISEITEFNGLPIDRLRELAEADKDGRVVVLPCQLGERVFAILDGEKHVRECEVEHTVLDDLRKVFAIRPVGYAQNAYYAPFGAFGRTVFLTREEAEKALEAMRKGGGVT